MFKEIVHNDKPILINFDNVTKIYVSEIYKSIMDKEIDSYSVYIHYNYPNTDECSNYDKFNFKLQLQADTLYYELVSYLTINQT